MSQNGDGVWEAVTLLLCLPLFPVERDVRLAQGGEGRGGAGQPPGIMLEGTELHQQNWSSGSARPLFQLLSHRVDFTGANNTG